MIGSLIIVFREVIEAGLIVGIVLAATHGVLGRARWIWLGIGVGIGGAALLATFAGAVSNAIGGAGQELFNAFVLGIAVIMLAWHSIWMTRHGREMASHLRAVGQAISMGTRSLSALALVVGIAVLREGSEIVLFLYGLMLSGSDSGWSLFAGGVAGLALGLRLELSNLPGPAYYSAWLSLRRDQRVDRVLGSGDGSAMRVLSGTGQRRHDYERRSLEHIRNPFRKEHSRAGIAHSYRL